MRKSIKQELVSHIIDKIDDGVLTNDNHDEWHHLSFNQDYYIIGSYNCKQWLKEHDIDVFEAITFCQEYEKDNFGECQTYDNAEKLVNMFVYILGEIIFQKIYNIKSVETLKDRLLDVKITQSLKTQTR